MWLPGMNLPCLASAAATCPAPATMSRGEAVVVWMAACTARADLLAAAARSAAPASRGVAESALLRAGKAVGPVVNEVASWPKSPITGDSRARAVPASTRCIRAPGRSPALRAVSIAAVAATSWSADERA